MGGHGGLNILPQKSWHVYNQDNREKVARDEAKFEEEEGEKRQKHQQAEREYRHRLLLARARGQKEALPRETVTPDAAGWPGAAPGTARAAAAAKPLEHINFWKEDELKVAHPEVKEEKRKEQRRRGNKDTQTSDARFDESFKLANGLYGKAALPWYATAGTTLPSEDASAQPDIGQDVKLALPTNGFSAASPSLALAVASTQRSNKEKHRHKDRKKRHKDKDKKSSKKRKMKGSNSGDSSSSSSEEDERQPSKRQRKSTAAAIGKEKMRHDVMAQLREERLAREAAERERERKVQLGPLVRDLAEGPRRYNNTFGFARDPPRWGRSG